MGFGPVFRPINRCLWTLESMKTILDTNQIAKAIEKMADEIGGDLPRDAGLVIIGIRSRGEIIAQRLAKRLSQAMGVDVPCGILDITLYRDDLNDPQGYEQPQVRSTEISFDIDGKIILLVDDVLYTGRSVRAAMDALIDLGRPRAIRLAVLIDRGHHELPIQADFAGNKVEIQSDESVEVNLVETDNIDQVVIR